MKNRWLNTTIILLVTALVLYLLLKDNYYEIIDTIRCANIFYIILGLVFYIGYMFFDMLNFNNLTLMYTNKISFKYQIYLASIFRFFSGITPLSTGGQPMQVYEMKKKGVSYTTGSNIAIQSFMIFQLSLIIFSILVIIFNTIFKLFIINDLVKTLTIIGFSINFIILFLLLLVSFSKNFNRKIINFIINILAKFKIIKNKEKQEEKWDKTCNEYYDNAKILLKNKKVLISGIILELLSLICYSLVPLFLGYAIGEGANLNIINTVVASTYVFILGCYIPIPGATGGMEFAFLNFFGNFVKGPKLNAFLLIWRFSTYYLPVLIGGIVYNIHNIKEEK